MMPGFQTGPCAIEPAQPDYYNMQQEVLDLLLTLVKGENRSFKRLSPLYLLQVCIFQCFSIFIQTYIKIIKVIGWFISGNSSFDYIY